MKRKEERIEGEVKGGPLCLQQKRVHTHTHTHTHPRSATLDLVLVVILQDREGECVAVLHL